LKVGEAVYCAGVFVELAGTNETAAAFRSWVELYLPYFSTEKHEVEIREGR
jgi:hypothetical protein